MLIAQMFVPALRVGSVGMIWMFAFALLLGLGLGPVISEYATYDQSALYQAAGGTALTVGVMGSYGFATSRDLIRWMRPAVLGAAGGLRAQHRPDPDRLGRTPAAEHRDLRDRQRLSRDLLPDHPPPGDRARRRLDRDGRVHQHRQHLPDAPADLRQQPLSGARGRARSASMRRAAGTLACSSATRERSVPGRSLTSRRR